MPVSFFSMSAVYGPTFLHAYKKYGTWPWERISPDLGDDWAMFLVVPDDFFSFGSLQLWSWAYPGEYFQALDPSSDT